MYIYPGASEADEFYQIAAVLGTPSAETWNLHVSAETRRREEGRHLSLSLSLSLSLALSISQFPQPSTLSPKHQILNPRLQPLTPTP